MDVPDNGGNAQLDAVNTGVTPNAVGSFGSITFWWRARSGWNGSANYLFDATTQASKLFYLGKRNNSRLRFEITDNASTPVTRRRRNRQHRRRRQYVEAHRGDMATRRRNECDDPEHLSRRRPRCDRNRHHQRPIQRVTRHALHRRQPQCRIERNDRIAHVGRWDDRRIPHLPPHSHGSRRTERHGGNTRHLPVAGCLAISCSRIADTASTAASNQLRFTHSTASTDWLERIPALRH